METLLNLVDTLRANWVALAFCIGFPTALAIVLGGDGPSVGGSNSDCDGD